MGRSGVIMTRTLGIAAVGFAVLMASGSTGEVPSSADGQAGSSSSVAPSRDGPDSRITGESPPGRDPGGALAANEPRPEGLIAQLGVGAPTRVARPLEFLYSDGFSSTQGAN